jgi:hypothetical protein
VFILDPCRLPVESCGPHLATFPSKNTYAVCLSSIPAVCRSNRVGEADVIIIYRHSTRPPSFPSVRCSNLAGDADVFVLVRGRRIGQIIFNTICETSFSTSESAIFGKYACRRIGQSMFMSTTILLRPILIFPRPEYAWVCQMIGQSSLVLQVFSLREGFGSVTYVGSDLADAFGMVRTVARDGRDIAEGYVCEAPASGVQASKGWIGGVCLRGGMSARRLRDERHTCTTSPTRHEAPASGVQAGGKGLRVAEHGRMMGGLRAKPGRRRQSASAC